MKHMGNTPQYEKEVLLAAQAHLRMAIDLINKYASTSEIGKDAYKHPEVEPIGRVVSRLHV